MEVRRSSGQLLGGSGKQGVPPQIAESRNRVRCGFGLDSGRRRLRRRRRRKRKRRNKFGLFWAKTQNARAAQPSGSSLYTVAHVTAEAAEAKNRLRDVLYAHLFQTWQKTVDTGRSAEFGRGNMASDGPRRQYRNRTTCREHSPGGISRNACP
jgi:hypothetical protein